MNRSYQYRGIKGLNNIAQEMGIPYGALRRRIYILHLSIDAAVALGRGEKVPKPTQVVPLRKVSRSVRSEVCGYKKKEVQQVGIRHPDLLNLSWKLALGMGASQ
jgi:hypothetical protein